MGLSLKNIVKKVHDVIGAAADDVIPGNQSSWHQWSQPTVYQQSSAPQLVNHGGTYYSPNVSVRGQAPRGFQVQQRAEIVKPKVFGQREKDRSVQIGALNVNRSKLPTAKVSTAPNPIESIIQGIGAAPAATAVKLAAAKLTHNPVAARNAIVRDKAVLKENLKPANIATSITEAGAAQSLGNAVKKSLSKPPVAQVKVPKITNTIPKLGSNLETNMDHFVNNHIQPGSNSVKLRNPVTRGSTAAQEVYRTGVDKVRDVTNDQLLKGMTSSNRAVSKTLNVPTNIFNRFGQKDAIRNIVRVRNGMQENAGRVVRQLANDQGNKIAQFTNPGKSLDRLNQHLMDMDLLKRVYGPQTTRLPYSKLTKAEQSVADHVRNVNKMSNNINLQIGKIDKDQFRLGTRGQHQARIFDFKGRKTGSVDANPNMDTGVSVQRKNPADFSDETIGALEKNPVMAAHVRLEIAMRDQATHEALDSLKKQGLIRKAAPNNKFSQLSGKQYGKYDGHYIFNPVRSEIDKNLAYDTKSGKAVGDLINSYQRSWMGGLDRFFKSTKTTLSPGTFLGNVISNPIAFNPASGVNGLRQSANMAKTAAKLTKDNYGKFDRSLYEARKQGVGINDTGRQLTGDRRAEHNLTVDMKHSKNPAKIAGTVYGGADQAAQVALYDELVRRGLTPERAARRVQLGTQDYGSAGRAIQNLSDAPLLGKPFARFTPELLRLVKNNLIYNPVGTAVKGAAVILGEQALSHKAGETEQERNAREDAVGQTQIPFTHGFSKALTGRDKNISLNLPIKQASVNIARLTGLNYPIEPGGTASGALVRQLDPTAVSDMIRQDAQGRNRVEFEKGISSLTGRPIAEQIANRDFMDRQISDPDNKTYIAGVGDKGKKFAGTPSTHDKVNNRLRAAGTGYVPFFNEGNAVKSAVSNQKDYYGKQRTPTQAILRSLGVKVESNSKDARQSRVDIQQYFDGQVAQVDKFLRANPQLANSYATIVSKTIDRKNNTRTNDTINPEKWKIIASEPTGALFGQFKSEAQYANKHSKNSKGMGKPVDPIFTLPPDQVREVMNLRATDTGDDKERKGILKASAPWYSNFTKAESKYYDDNNAYYKDLHFASSGSTPGQNPRVKAYNDIQYPAQPSIISQYYATKDKDATAGKAFYKAHANELNSAFDQNDVDNLNYINSKRAIEGASPISMEVYKNVTTGYQADPNKTLKALQAKGYGGFSNSVRFRSSGSSSTKVFDPSSHYANPHKADLPNKADKWRKVSVAAKPANLSGIKVRSKSSSKSKVAMKLTKSKV